MKKSVMISLGLLVTAALVLLGYWSTTLFSPTTTTQPATTTTTTESTTTTTQTPTVVLSFIVNGGEEVDSMTGLVGSEIIAPTDPVRTGFTFEGWFTDNVTFNNRFVFSVMPSTNVTLYAKWAINQYTVEYVDHNGDVLQTANYDYGADLSTVTPPANPTRIGYTFNSWSGIVPATMGTSKITVTATYTINQYAVEYADHNGDVLQTANYDYGADLSAVTPPVNPTRIGYSFNGWSGIVPALMGTSKITVTATYTINQYALEYVDYNGDVLQTTNYDYGADLTAVTPPANPTRIGYSFDSWSGAVPALMGTSKVTVTATYTVLLYTITLNTSGGNLMGSLSGASGEAVSTPSDPTRAGYSFTGWFSDEAKTTPYTFTVYPSDNITVYAGWASANLSFTLINSNTEYEVSRGTATGDIIIPATYLGLPVTKIADNAFDRFGNPWLLTSMVIPEGIKIIGQNAFRSYSLTSISLPATIERIEAYAFTFAQITTIQIPAHVSLIGLQNFSSSTS